MLDDHVLGLYVIESRSEKQFQSADAQILMALVSQAVTAIANIRLLKEIELGKTVLESLHAIDRNMMDMGKSLALHDMLGVILDESLRLVSGKYGVIALINKNNELTIRVSTKENLTGKSLGVDDSLSGQAYKLKTTQYIPDINEASEETRRLQKNWLGDHLVCSLAVPMSVQGEVIGILALESDVPDNFSQTIDRVRVFAGQAAVAIHIGQLLEDITKARMHFRALAAIESKILNAHKSLSETLDMILRGGTDLVGKRHAAVMLRNDAGELVVRRTTQPSDEGKKISSDSISGLAVREMKTVYMPYIDSDERPADVIEADIHIPNKAERLSYKRAGWGPVKSQLSLPLIVQGEVIGVFSLESVEYEDFRSYDRDILKNLANTAAIAINNAQLFDEITVKNQELKDNINKDRIALSKILGRIVNHRIGNSIGTIRLSISNILDGDFGSFNEEARAEFLKIKQSAEIALGSREEVRDKVTQIIRSDPAPINFPEMQRRIEQLPQLRQFPEITITITGFQDLPPVLADMSLLTEVAFELTINAAKSMDGKGPITIIGKAEQGFVVISFSDKGCGIEEAYKNVIFDRNYSYWPTKKAGSGIGLSGVRDTLELYRGSIGFTSELNKGTTFTIKLPIMQDTQSSDTGPATKGKVLVIENEKDWQTDLKTILEKAGYFVVVAETLPAAIQIVQKELFHFITIDMRLDDNNTEPADYEGWDVLAILKQLRTQDTTPAMVITGYPEDYQDHWRKKRLRSVFFMSKGAFDRKEFIKIVEIAVQSHDLRFKDDHRGD